MRSVIDFLLLASLPTVHSIIRAQRRNVSENALWNLGLVTECELRHNAFVYNNYGCWCGNGGAHTPIDGIDTCCMNHDKCYEAVRKDGKCVDTVIEYFTDYRWDCKDHVAVLKENESPCQAALFACDKAVVDCWGQYPKPPFFGKPRCTHRI